MESVSTIVKKVGAAIRTAYEFVGYALYRL